MFLSSRYKGTPYPEVTVSICRVPSPEFSQAPEYIQLAHQCRFTVRSRTSWSLEAFPGSTSDHFGSVEPRCFVSKIRRRICQSAFYTHKPGHPTPGRSFMLRPPIALVHGAEILICFPSTTLLSLALGADSPCSDERRAGTLGLAASGLFTRFNVTHVSIRTSDTSSIPYETPSQAYRTLPYHLHLLCKSALSVIDLAPLHLPRMRTRSVSYYAFFEGWLLLSQLPDCLSLHTSFST